MSTCCQYVICSCCEPGATPTKVAGWYTPIAADTLGFFYRAFAPIFNGGQGVVDPWTKDLLVCCEKQQLIKAGTAPSDAQSQAETDVEKTIATAPSLKKCQCKTPNILMWIAIVIGAAILLIIFGNVAAKKAVGA